MSLMLSAPPPVPVHGAARAGHGAARAAAAGARSTPPLPFAARRAAAAAAHLTAGAGRAAGSHAAGPRAAVLSSVTRRRSAAGAVTAGPVGRNVVWPVLGAPRDDERDASEATDVTTQKGKAHLNPPRERPRIHAQQANGNRLNEPVCKRLEVDAVKPKGASLRVAAQQGFPRRNATTLIDVTSGPARLTRLAAVLTCGWLPGPIPPGRTRAAR